MPLKRLTKTQIAGQGEEVRPLLAPYTGETIRAMLAHIGVWERVAPFTPPVADSRELSPEEQRRAVLAGLFEKAKGGDASAARAFNEMLEKQRSEGGPAAPSSVVVQIVPYDVPDKLCARDAEPA